MERDQLLSPQELEALLGADDDPSGEGGFELLFTPDDFVNLVDFLRAVASRAFREATAGEGEGLPLEDLRASLVAPARFDGVMADGDVLRSVHFDRGLDGRLCFRLGAEQARLLAARLLEGDPAEEGEELPPTHVAALSAMFDRFVSAWRRAMQELHGMSCHLSKGKARLWPGKARKLLAPLRDEEHLLEIDFAFGGAARGWPGAGQGIFWITLPLARGLVELAAAPRTPVDPGSDPAEPPAPAKAPTLARRDGTSRADGGAPVDVAGVMGHARLSAEAVARLRAGQVLPLDRLAGELVDLVADGRVLAKGEVVVKDDHVAVRLLSVAPAGKDGA